MEHSIQALGSARGLAGSVALSRRAAVLERPHSLSQRRSHRREAYAEPKKVEALAVIELGVDAVISPRPPFWLIVAIKAGFALRHSLGREARKTGP